MWVCKSNLCCFFFPSCRKFTCHLCDRSFTEKWALNNHMKLHTGEKPFKCTWPTCHYSFLTASAMKDHYRTHTGVTHPFLIRDWAKEAWWAWGACTHMSWMVCLIATSVKHDFLAEVMVIVFEINVMGIAHENVFLFFHLQCWLEYL